MPTNSRWRKINEFLAISGIGKQQSAFGTFLNDASLDTRENCDVAVDIVVERGEQRNCDNVDLIGQPVKSRFRRFKLTYNQPTAQQIFRMLAYKEGAVTSPTGTPASQIQTLSRTGTVSGGTFTLAMTLEGKTGITRPIPFNATNTQLLAAITQQFNGSLGKIVKPGDVVIAGNWTSGITLTFAARLAKASLPVLTVSNTAITGGGTVGAAITQAGTNNFHTASRSASGSKPLFSIATGNKAQSIATTKYGDAVVESVDLTANADNANLSMVVVIACNFNPDLPASFTVPACVNSTPVRTQDIRLQINSVYEQPNLVNHAITLNDNVPVKSAFAYDDIDMSSAMERGNQPEQEFTTEIYGDATHPLYVLATEEYVENNTVPFNTILGNPGNRVSILAPETKIKPQTNLTGFSGEAEQSTIKFTGTPYGISGNPFSVSARLDQAVSFLQIET